MFQNILAVFSFSNDDPPETADIKKFKHLASFFWLPFQSSKGVSLYTTFTVYE